MDEVASSGSDDSDTLADISREQIRRGGFKEFVRQAWPLVEGNRPFKWNWHIEALCDHLQALYDRKLGKHKLLANVPPRTSKSTILSVMFPCWVWTQNPNLSFVFASYSFNLARDHAYKRRAILDSSWFRDRWGHVVQMSEDRNNIAEMSNRQHGTMYTTSTDGTTTGKGGDILILDDPNSAEEMESEVQRASVLRFIDVTWSTRMNDPANYLEILIQQRTHVDDVTGHVLKKNPDEWCHFKVPMEYDPDRRCVTPIWADPRTFKGELLDAERFPKAFVDQKRRDLGPYFYAGQYDQEPAPAEGGIIKRSWILHYEVKEGRLCLPKDEYKIDPMNCVRFCTVDLATSKKDTDKADPDYTVIAAWCVFHSHRGTLILLLDLVRERLAGPDIEKKIEAMDQVWKFSVLAIETIGFQLNIAQQLLSKGYRVREVSSSLDAIYRIDKDKVARAYGATPLMADGRFYTPTYATWLGEYIHELIRFPAAGHDDQVDVTSIAVAIADKIPARSIYQEQDERSDRITQSADAGYNLGRDDEVPDAMEGFRSRG